MRWPPEDNRKEDRHAQPTGGRRARPEGQIKKEMRERDKDESWKGDALKEANDAEKRARRPQASEDERTAGLAVPRDGEA